MKHPRFLSLLLVLVMAMGLCGVAGAESPVALEVWSPLTGAKATTLDNLVAEFNESQSDVEVTVVHQGGYDILRQKMAAAANAGNIPPIILADYIDVALYVQRGLLYPIGEVLDAEVMADYFPSMMEDLTVDGVAYAIPYNRSTQGYYVNNDLLAEAGLSGPATTWEQFRKDAETLKETMGDDYYYGYAVFNQFLFDAISYSWGAPISTPEGEVLLTDPHQVEMFQFFQDMYNDGLLLMQPVVIGGFQEQHGAFLEGKVATVFQTTSFMPTAEEILTDIDWSFEMIPAGEGGHAITIGGSNVAVTSAVTDEQLPGVKTFLEFISDPAATARVFIETANLPVRMSTLEMDEVKTYLAENPSAQMMMDQLEYGKPAPSVTKNIRDVFTQVSDLVTRIIYYGEDVEAVLQEYNDEFQAQFEEAKLNDEYVY